MTATIISVSVPAEMQRVIREKGWSPSQIFRTGFMRMASGNSEMQEMREKNERLAAKVAELANRLNSTTLSRLSMRGGENVRK